MLSADLLYVCVFCVAVGFASLVELLLQLCPMGVLHRFNCLNHKQKNFSAYRTFFVYVW